jgi:putative transposase
MLSRGFRYRIYPTPEQESLFRQFAGVCRLVYNLGLEQRRDFWRQYQRQTGKTISVVSQCKELTELRAAVDWIAAVPVNVQQQALRDLDKAFANFFAKRADYPRPRRKGEYDAFRFPAIHCGELRKLNAKWSVIRLPKLGDVKVRTHRALEGRALSITIAATAGKWFASFGCEIDREPAPDSTRPAVGIDRGVARTLTLSTGKAMSLDREHLKLLDRRARKAQRAVSRKKRGSRRAAKAKVRLARVKSQVAAYRKDWSHKASFHVARRFGLVVLEKLATSRMTRSAKGTVDQPGKNVRAKAGLNRAILEQGWHHFEIVLGYKLEERGGHLLTVDPRHTSQTCAACGAVDAASRPSQSKFECVACGHEANADYNAALVILHRGQSAGVERDVGPASKREAKGRKAPKTSASAAAQLVPVHPGGSRKRLRPQALAG